MNVEAVLDSKIGSIVAPAGCGKTHLITGALSIKPHKPILVLTHTTAGVSALKLRLRRLSVPPSHYVITTIDGWVLRIAKNFPASCPITASPDVPRYFYPDIRLSVLRALNLGGLSESIKATYSRLLVDEYQDCDINQHCIVSALAEVLPTVVFGDPMQCIFDFAGPMPNWEGEVLNRFPLLGTLDTPWRWNNAGAPELGEWVLSAREALQHGINLDFTNCPAHVKWHQLTGNASTNLVNQQTIQQNIINQNTAGSLLVIGSSMDVNSRHKHAQNSPTTQVVEPVQLTDIITAAGKFDRFSGIQLAKSVLQIASTMATNIEISKIAPHINSILNGNNTQVPNPLEQALYNLVHSNIRPNILNVLLEIEKSEGVNLYRTNAYTALKDSVSFSITSPDKTISEATNIVREQLRQRGESRIPQRAIGSTLLLKGLEAEHCLILNANRQEMNKNNLYVALSRGAKTINIFSQENSIQY